MTLVYKALVLMPKLRSAGHIFGWHVSIANRARHSSSAATFRIALIPRNIRMIFTYPKLIITILAGYVAHAASVSTIPNIFCMILAFVAGSFSSPRFIASLAGFAGGRWPFAILARHVVR